MGTAMFWVANGPLGQMDRHLNRGRHRDRQTDGGTFMMAIPSVSLSETGE